LIDQRRLKRYLRQIERQPRPECSTQAPKTIAIIVPCFQHAAFLRTTLASIAAQTRRPDEVVLIDDASGDGSSSILADYVASQPWLSDGRVAVLVHQANLGQAASLNEGVERTSSDLIMILNDDDYLMHDAVEAMMEYFRAQPELVMAGAHSIHFAGDEFLSSAGKLSSDYCEPGLPLTIHRPESVPGYRNSNSINMTHSGSCFRKEAWRGAGGYWPRRERLVPPSDRDFQLRVNALGPVGVAYTTPYSFWRTDSSVDRFRHS
jgi:glycosyltransferase involved in cell wall biosynthesis